jgi:uncharacterized secreted protein with C-terminal beta-propeller domain
MSLASRTRAVLCAASAAFACASALVACTPGGSDYISDNPFGSNNNNGEGNGATGTGAGGGSSDGSGGNDPGRAIAEADIIQIDGPRLYALSQYGGLSIIDISTPDKLTMLGRYRANGTPFEMYRRDNTIYAMFSGWGQYSCDANDTCTWIQSSHIEALDVSDPRHIQKIGSFELPGDISDSRIVGDVLYAVTYEDGYCWNCGSSPNTTVTSLNVADPAHIAVVDHLSFTSPDPNGYGWWKRSISVNQSRMYVAGVDWDGTGEGHSTIQVVDISDPAGHLAKGASVSARGQIESRWQMDEKDGVLRVISQPGVWWSQDVPTIQTFQVSSATDVTPIAELDLVLPQPERLRSVRFDGNRAYAITAVQMDPLFTIDLSDPAHPAQVGELQMPGWVYFMEPRGDRLYALGYEQNNPEGSLAVSLFDVQDLANPTMISRVNFGGDWSNLPEDQDRIHKSFNIDSDNGAIFVPYSAWNYDKTNDYYGCGSYESGIQIIDFTADSLTKRGSAPSKGGARRAFVHDSRLFGVSDAQVSTFDIANRDAPVQTAQLPLSTDVSHVVVAGNNVVRLANDWWTGAARLDIVPASDPGRETPIGSLDLAALDPDGQQYGWCWGWSYYGAKVFTNGNFVYLVRTNSYYYGWEDGPGYPTNGPTADIQVIDISNPASPTPRGKLSFPLPLWYRWYGGVVSGGEDVVQVNGAIVFRSLTANGWDPNTIETATLEVIDLSNPDSPNRTSVALADGYGHTALIASGHKVRTSHWSPIQGQPDKVRFYVDELDVANPAAPTLNSINVPGSLLAYDVPSERYLTVDYQRITRTEITGKECNDLFGYNAQFTYDDNTTNWDWETSKGTCVGLHRTLKLVEVEGISADVISEVEVDDKVTLSDPLAGDDRVFANAYGYYYYGDGTGSGPQVVIVGGMRDGDLRVIKKTLGANDYSYATAVAGKKLVMVGYNPPGLYALDATDLDHVTVARKADLQGYSYDVTVSGDTALCSLGPWGLQSVDLSQ